MEKKAYLEIAKIINTHGVRGAVKLDLWCDGPQTFKKIKKVYLANGTEYEVSDVKTVGAFAVCSLSGVSTVEDAVKLKNKILFAKREDIPLKKGAVLLADIIGLDVIDIDTGKIYGKVKDITDAPRSRIFAVECDDGREVLIPEVKEFIKEIDADKGVFIHTIPGFFD